MKKERPNLTSLPLCLEHDHKRRVVHYCVIMGIRLLCLIVALFLPGWWALLPVLGTIFLPYFAVVIANVSSQPSSVPVARPGHLMRNQDS